MDAGLRGCGKLSLVMRRLIPLLGLPLCGCAIAARSDKFGMDFELGVGGIVSYIADFNLKLSVGFSKTHPDKRKEGKDEPEAGDDGADPLGLDHFL